MRFHLPAAPGALRLPLLALALPLALTACFGDDDEPLVVVPATTVTAAADTATIDVGQTATLLANDRIGGAAANAGTGGNASFTLVGAAPTGVTVSSAGNVSIGDTAVPGVYTLSYRLCEVANASNCATGSAQITVPTPAITARADTLNLAPGSSGDVLANDTLGAAAATATRVTAIATTALPTGVNFTAAGVMTAGSTAVAGSYTVTYRICQTVAPTNCASADITLTVPTVGTLTGRAIDAATAAGIAGVTVSAGGLSATTDSTGAFTLSGLAASDRLPVIFNVDSHAEAASIASITAAQTSDVQVRMVRVGATVAVGVSTGGTVTMSGSPAQVVLPADGVQRADGSVPTGNMTVRITPIDPASDSSVMPGDFSTLVSGTPEPIESFGALNVRLSDSAGAPLNLRSGQTATVRIPLSSRDANPPASIPLFYFDNASGLWVQEGTATLAGTGTGRYYQGTVTHFTTWNADLVSTTVRVSGCVADASGNRIARARVSSDGINYSGTSSATTDAAGNFRIPIRRSSTATLVARSGVTLSNTVRAGPYANDSALTGCLTLGQTNAGLTMKLTWGALPDDLDSHLIAPTGEEIYYSNEGSLTAEPFANLDVDDTTSFGPEVITISKLMVGTYKYYILNYSGFSEGPIAASSARVELNIPGRAAELFTPPATGETAATDVWTLFELDVDAQCNVTVRRTPGYAVETRESSATRAPVYCTR